MRYDLEKTYRLISPRLLVLVTTLDVLKAINAMPTTFIAPISFKPPIILISVDPRSNTYDNILDNKEFVINILPEEYTTKVLKCGKHYPKGFNKLEEVGLKWFSSQIVRPPRVKEAKVWIECKFIGGLQVDHTRTVDHVPLLGEAVAAEVSDDVITNGEIDMSKLKPALHITGENFATSFQIVRKRKYEE